MWIHDDKIADLSGDKTANITEVQREETIEETCNYVLQGVPYLFDKSNLA